MTYKELAFCLKIILKIKIQSYQLLHFLVDTTIKPPIKESYLIAQHLKPECYTATLENILKTVIFFNQKQYIFNI